MSSQSSSLTQHTAHHASPAGSTLHWACRPNHPPHPEAPWLLRPEHKQKVSRYNATGATVDEFRQTDTYSAHILIVLCTLHLLCCLLLVVQLLNSCFFSHSCRLYPHVCVPHITYTHIQHTSIARYIHRLDPPSLMVHRDTSGNPICDALTGRSQECACDWAPSL